MTKTFHLRPWGRISDFLTVTADSDSDALGKVKQAFYAGREGAFPSEWEIHAGTIPAQLDLERRRAVADLALPPADWQPPSTPIGFDRVGTSGNPIARLTEAIEAMLQHFGPMTAEEVGLALVVYGFGPLIEGLDMPSIRKKRRRRPKQGPRWRQRRLPGIN